MSPVFSLDYVGYNEAGLLSGHSSMVFMETEVEDKIFLVKCSVN